MNKLRRYFQGVISEIKKVSFPSRQETWDMATLVIVLSSLIAIYVTLADLGFSKFVSWLLPV